MRTPVMYHGQRVSFNGKIVQLFRDQNGKGYTFTGIKNVWFGDIYFIENDSMKIRPQQIEQTWKPTDEDRLEYEAQKIAVAGQRQNRLKAMTFRRPHVDILRAVELIRPFTHHISMLDQRRFFEWLANECSKQHKPRGKK